MHRDRTNIVNRDFLEFDSSATDSALMKPATGALILSSKLTNLRIKHKTTLYAELNTAVNPPNCAELQMSCALNLFKWGNCVCLQGFEEFAGVAAEQQYIQRYDRAEAKNKGLECFS